MFKKFSSKSGKNIKYLYATKRAESLVEVIMAIFVITIGSTVAATLIISALQSNEFSRDNLVATNLAVEGIEAMRSIRDSNWLKFSYNKVGCWNEMPEYTTCTAQSNQLIAPNNYTIDLNLTPNSYAWGLTAVSSATLNLSNPTGNDPYQLYSYNIGSGETVLATKGNTTVPSGITSAPSNFYRMIQVNYLTNPANPACSTTTGQGCEEMNVTSTVQWLAEGTVHQVVLQTKLTDYQKVKVQS